MPRVCSSEEQSQALAQVPVQDAVTLSEQGGPLASHPTLLCPFSPFHFCLALNIHPKVVLSLPSGRDSPHYLRGGCGGGWANRSCVTEQSLPARRTATQRFILLRPPVVMGLLTAVRCL